jgi:uncharacterized membrane protein
MGKTRLEAFSDGVIAIIITIMVLELKVPHGGELEDLRPLGPVFLSYVLSFIYVAIYWNNHHHMLHTVKRVTGGIMWANSHLLFWLSLVPFTTSWVGEHPQHPLPMALYGVNLLMAGVAYLILQWAIVGIEGADGPLRRAIGSDWKGKLSAVGYLAAIGLAFVDRWISIAIYFAMAAIWFIPDRRIAKTLAESPPAPE